MVRWTADGTTTECNNIVFTEESRFCLQHHDGHIRVWRHRVERLLNCCVMHRHIGLAPGIMVWDGIGFPSRTPLVRIAGNRTASVASLRCWSLWSSHTFSACHLQYSKSIMHEHTWHAMFKSYSLHIRLNRFLGLLVLPDYRQSKMCGPCLHNEWLGIHPRCSSDELW